MVERVICILCSKKDNKKGLGFCVMRKGEFGGKGINVNISFVLCGFFSRVILGKYIIFFEF